GGIGATGATGHTGSTGATGPTGGLATITRVASPSTTIGFGGVTVSATCTGNSRLVGGGYDTAGSANYVVSQSSPSSTTRSGSWTVTIADGSCAGCTVTVFALCASP